MHFEISADQLKRAIRFYNDVFAWQVNKWDGPEDYWLITTGDEDQLGIDGGFIRHQDCSATIINTIDVSSVDDFVLKIAQNGGKLVTPKMSIPGAGYVAYCQDTETNTFGIFQADASAS